MHLRSGLPFTRAAKNANPDGNRASNNRNKPQHYARVCEKRAAVQGAQRSEFEQSSTAALKSLAASSRLSSFEQAWPPSTRTRRFELELKPSMALAFTVRFARAVSLASIQDCRRANLSFHTAERLFAHHLITPWRRSIENVAGYGPNVCSPFL